MATLGAELGCKRYLASTVVTDSGQRSSTFLAKLRRNSVFVLALRAFHCRPRRKKRARCTARVTSHMIGDKADALNDVCPPNIPAMLGGRIERLSSLREEEALLRQFGAFPGVRECAARVSQADNGSASFRLDIG